MKKELDKELYPDYVYPEFTPDPNEPFREPIEIGRASCRERV